MVGLIDPVLAWLAAAVKATLDGLWDLLAGTAFTTPDVTDLPQVESLTGRSLTIVNAGFVLVIMAVGATAMTHQTLQIRYSIGELLPRMVIGFIAANFSTPLCSNLIEIANALTEAITGESINAEGTFAHLKLVVGRALAYPHDALLLVVLGLILAVLAVMLLAVWLVRVGVLIVLVGIAPIALACHALPFTEGAAKLWWRSFVGVLATVMLQAVAVHTVLTVFLDPDANKEITGRLTDTSPIINLLIVICLLWVTVKIPGLVRRYVTRGGQGSNVAFLMRMLIVRQITGLVRFPALSRTTRPLSRSQEPSNSPAATTKISYWRPRLPKSTPAVPPAGTGRRAPSPSESAAGLPRPVLPPGVNPGTVMPRTRAGGLGSTTSGLGWPALKPPTPGPQRIPSRPPRRPQPPAGGTDPA